MELLGLRRPLRQSYGCGVLLWFISTLKGVRANIECLTDKSHCKVSCAGGTPRMCAKFDAMRSQLSVSESLAQTVASSHPQSVHDVNT